MDLSGLFRGIPFYSENLIPLSLLLIVICVLEWLIPRLMGYRSTVKHQVLKIIFAVYLLLLFEMTVSLESLWRSAHEGFPVKGEQMTTLFREIHNFFYYGNPREIAINLVGNVLVFIPMGLLPPLLWRWARRGPGVLFWCLIPSCVVEFLQLFTPRSTSVDDVVLNASGALLGYFIFFIIWLIRIRTKPAGKRQL